MNLLYFVINNSFIALLHGSVVISCGCLDTSWELCTWYIDWLQSQGILDLCMKRLTKIWSNAIFSKKIVHARKLMDVVNCITCGKAHYCK